MDNLKQGMASIYLALALREHHITVKGSKDRFRDFVYIDDIVDAVQKTMNRTKGELFEVYNVANCKKIHVHEIVDIIENLFLLQLLMSISKELRAIKWEYMEK